MTSNIGSKVINSIVVADFNADQMPEIVASSDNGDLFILDLFEVNYNHSPLKYDFPFSSSPTIHDIDFDGDLEIIIGTTNSIYIADIKDSGDLGNYWNVYANNYNRSNYYIASNDCLLGDVDVNNNIDILDVVNLINIVLNDELITEYLLCLCDFNFDNIINIQDIILLIEYIFENN